MDRAPRQAEVAKMTDHGPAEGVGAADVGRQPGGVDRCDACAQQLAGSAPSPVILFSLRP